MGTCTLRLRTQIVAPFRAAWHTMKTCYRGQEVIDMNGEVQLGNQVFPARIVNLTPHDVEIFTAQGRIVFPPSGKVARCNLDRNAVGTFTIDGKSIPLSHNTLGVVNGLPEPQEGIYYIVSFMVASAAPERNDLLIPDAPLKDGNGRTIGCRALCLVSGSHIAFAGAKRRKDAPANPRGALPPLRVTYTAPEQEESNPNDGLGSSNEKIKAHEDRGRYRRPARSAYVTQSISFDNWLQQVDQLLREQIGRRVGDFRMSWRRLYNSGLDPSEVVSSLFSFDFSND